MGNTDGPDGDGVPDGMRRCAARCVGGSRPL